MAKKKNKVFDPDDPDNWSEAQVYKYVLDRVTEIAKNLPWDKIVLCSVFTIAWWKAYGAGPRPTKGDVMLGVTYGLTIPEALKGGEIAGTYAVAALSALALGLVAPSPIDKVKEAIEAEQEAAYEAGREAAEITADIAQQIMDAFTSQVSVTQEYIAQSTSGSGFWDNFVKGLNNLGAWRWPGDLRPPSSIQ